MKLDLVNKFNKFGTFAFLGFCIMLFSGCAQHAQIDMLERNVSGLQVETNRLGEEVQSIKREMEAVKGQSVQGGRKSIARLNARIDSLESELMRLNGLVDQIKYNQEREEAELAQLREAINAGYKRTKRVATLPPSSPSTSSISSTSPVKIVKKNQIVQDTKVVSPVVTNSATPSKPEDLYKEGLELFNLKRYQEAKEVFKDFIKQNPTSPLVANAHFWIGECEYKQSRYEEAILEYNKVISKFPKSNKVPDALLKQGYAFAKLGDKESAKILLKRLVKNYPKTPQAKAAKRQLKLLK